MPLYLFSLAFVLAISRGLYHILWASLAPRGRLAFWGVVALASFASYVLLGRLAHPFTMTVLGIWAFIGIAGWFVPELLGVIVVLFQEGFRRATRVPLPKLAFGIAATVSVIVMFIDQETIGYFGTIWALVFAVWLIITKGFSLGSAPAKKRKRR